MGPHMKIWVLFAYLILEKSPDHEFVVTDDVTAPKKSTSRKKRRSKLSTKKSSEKSLENSPRFFEEEDPDFFPDPNLRLALQSLRVRLNCNGDPNTKHLDIETIWFTNICKLLIMVITMSLLFKSTFDLNMEIKVCYWGQGS